MCVRPWTRICWWMSLAWRRDLHCLRSIDVVVGLVENKALVVMLVKCLLTGFRQSKTQSMLRDYCILRITI